MMLTSGGVMHHHPARLVMMLPKLISTTLRS
jgi:hypothetical protein